MPRSACSKAALRDFGDAATFEVSVGADARHGTLACVLATPRSADARALDAAVREALDRFSVRYEITWKELQP